MSSISMHAHHEFRPTPLYTAALETLAGRRRFLKGLFPTARKFAASHAAPDTCRAMPARLIV